MNRRLIARIAQPLLALTLLLVTFAWGGGATSAAPRAAGAVFTLTNAAGGNAVVAFDRADDGALTPAGTYATGGLGSGKGLGSQGALALSSDHRWLFVVNAGSADLSVFAVDRSGLQLTDRVPSGGDLPISLTYHDDLLYVLNAGGVANISGFRFDDGHLRPITGSTRRLSQDNPGPAEVQFSPSGAILAVTEKATNIIDTFVVGEDGVAGTAQVYASAGVTPYGFAFDRRGRLITSDAAGGAAGAGTASSYQVDAHGGLKTVSGALPIYQSAPCWVVVTGNGRYAYEANAGSNTITGLRIGQGGELSLLSPNGVSGTTGANSHPADMATSSNSHFLYVRNGNGTIGAFAIAGDGSLSPLGGVGGLAGVVGLAAY
jgi:6-phosphogluconolactonase (cycloisomerase 2 family)